MYFLLSFLLIR